MEDAVKLLKNQLVVLEAELKEMNTAITRLELASTSAATLAPIRVEQRERQERIAQLKRMIEAAAPISLDASRPTAFSQKTVATTRRNLTEVMERVKELRAAGKIKGRRQRLPLDDCYDLIKSNAKVHAVVMAQFWAQVSGDKDQNNGLCWTVREPFKVNRIKGNLVKTIYIAALQTKLPAVRLSCILHGVAIDEDSSMRNTCGNEQCVKPTHQTQGRLKEKRVKKQKPSSLPPAPAPINLQETSDYQEYILELLQDQKEDGKAIEGMTFREAERILVTDRGLIPDRDSMIKAIRLEKNGKCRFHQVTEPGPNCGKIFLCGYVYKNSGRPVVPNPVVQERFKLAYER